jgi:hypothetical protein
VWVDLKDAVAELFSELSTFDRHDLFAERQSFSVIVRRSALKPPPAEKAPRPKTPPAEKCCVECGASFRPRFALEVSCSFACASARAERKEKVRKAAYREAHRAEWREWHRQEYWARARAISLRKAG